MPSRKKASRSTPVSVITPRLLTIQQSASYLGTTVWAIRSLVWNRQVPSIRIGKRILFDKIDLDAYVESRKKAAA